jgi:hypothetical protein
MASFTDGTAMRTVVIPTLPLEIAMLTPEMSMLTPEMSMPILRMRC